MLGNSHGGSSHAHRIPLFETLALLKNASRNHTIAVSWLGRCDHEHLHYGSPDHREFKRYPCGGLELIELHR